MRVHIISFIARMPLKRKQYRQGKDTTAFSAG
jgi:hypothetical protein